jgi:hypothetical protein
MVIRRLRDFLADGSAVLDALGPLVPEATAQHHIVPAAKDLGATLADLPSEVIRTLLAAICIRSQVHTDRVDIMIDRIALVMRLAPTAVTVEPTAASQNTSAVGPLVLSIAARLRRAGKEMRMVIDDGSGPANIDAGLVRVLLRGFAIRDQLFADHGLTLNDVAEPEGMNPSYATRLFRLSFLAPDNVATILDGRQPPERTVRSF